MTKKEKLEKFIPRPENKARERTLVTLSPEDYKRITKMAEDFDTTRGRIITALLEYYDE